MSDIWPTSADVSLDLRNAIIQDMTAEELGAYTRLAHCIAMMRVNTYSRAKFDPALPDDDVQLSRVARCTVRGWKKIKQRVMQDFDLRDDGWHLVADVVRFSRPSTRNPIPMAVKSAVMARDGRRCAYCGDETGPFHFDHLFPVAKGGQDEASNLVVACQTCNLSKRDRTIIEWLAYLRGRQ